MRSVIPLASAVLVLVLAGCSGTAEPSAPSTAPLDTRSLDEVALIADPRTAEGPATAALADSAIEPVLEAPASELPAEVVSHDADGDRTVTVADSSRVLALDISGALAATVWGLGFGDRLVGRDMSTTFPGTDRLPVVTSGAHAIDAETVLALAPTLLITDGSIGPRDVIEQLRQSGVTVVFVTGARSVESSAALARETAAALGAPEAGELLAERILDEVAAVETQIDAIVPAAAADRPRMLFLYLRGSAGIYYLFGEGSGADELIDAVRGVDVAAELGWEGERPMTDEALIAAQPDVVIVMTAGLASVGGVDELLAAKPALALTPAGVRRRLIDIDDGAALGFGPRTAEVIEALARAVYAEPAG